MNCDRDDLLTGVDLPDLWAAEGLTVLGNRRGGQCPSPEHSQTGATPPVSIGIADGHGVWNCHGCGAGGTAVDLLLLRRGMSVAEAMAHLRDRAGIRDRAAPNVAPRTIGAREIGAATPGTDQHLDRFLAERRWRRDVADRFGLAPILDKGGRPRIRFPFRADGKLLTWQDRAAAGQDPKYLAAPSKKLTLYAHDLTVALTNGSPGGRSAVIVVEGPPDVVAIAHAYPAGGVIGLPGVEWARKPSVAGALQGFDVIVAMDNDAAGEKARADLEGRLLAQGCRVAHLRYPDGCNDADDWRRALDADDDRFRVAFLAELDALEWQVIADGIAA